MCSHLLECLVVSIRQDHANNGASGSVWDLSPGVFTPHTERTGLINTPGKDSMEKRASSREQKIPKGSDIKQGQTRKQNEVSFSLSML